mmetsp:Transcript_63699/g.153825  ORF Transcript_63699/g.153825 Transcript_63699/m.153825 type:complete len:265 (+) Transcript_63699:53-847(+)
MDGNTLYAIAQPHSTSYTCMRGTQFTWRGMGVGIAAHGPTWAAGRTAAAGTASGVTARLKKEATSSAATSDSTARKAAAAASLMSGVRCSKPTTPTISFVEDCSRALRNSAVAVHTAACSGEVGASGRFARSRGSRPISRREISRSTMSTSCSCPMSTRPWASSGCDLGGPSVRVRSWRTLSWFMMSFLAASRRAGAACSAAVPSVTVSYAPVKLSVSFSSLQRRDRRPDSESEGFCTHRRRARAPISATADPTAAVLATAYTR